MFPPRAHEMKQLLQNASSGEIAVEDVPAPTRTPRDARSSPRRYSLISAGTERAQLELGRSSLLGKARARPDLVRKVLETARERGHRDASPRSAAASASPTRSATASPASCSRRRRGRRAAPGDRVACAGAGIAEPRGDRRACRRTCCARIPDGVQRRGRGFVTLGAIALQGVRLADAGARRARRRWSGSGWSASSPSSCSRPPGAVALGLDPDPPRAALARAGSAPICRGQRRGLEAAAAGCTDGPRRRRGDRHGREQVDARRSPGRRIAVARAARSSSAWSATCRSHRPRRRSSRRSSSASCPRSYGPGRYDPAYEERGPGLSVRLRALDRGPQHRGVPRAGRGRRARRRGRSRRTRFDRSTRPSGPTS